jgi:hypothetical protein
LSIGIDAHEAVDEAAAPDAAGLVAGRRQGPCQGTGAVGRRAAGAAAAITPPD